MKPPIVHRVHRPEVGPKIVGALFWIGAFALCLWLADRYLPAPNLTMAVFALGACIAASGHTIASALRDVAKAIRETSQTAAPQKWTPEEANGRRSVR